ncbi:FixH family protein [Caryophanon tenue]|uniref:YtkA-like domain-containing protein n=1 Tax=Caryophanon tenue TaxID=33978 RepID=A0A1C0YJB2_9BACL|nr:FixH family protein [Caryophanon tenue]OCS87231.1 hypothetical protein A6M13_11410 [Caryophanon tenue]
MKKRYVYSGLLIALLVSGCSEETSHSSHTEMQEMIELEYMMTEPLQAGEQTIAIQLTQHEEAVNDADSVIFEVWQAGHSDAAQKIEAVHTENGIYEAVYTFDDNTAYYVIAHTTAKGIHLMPKEQMIIGEVDRIPADDYRGSMDHS